MKVTIEDLHALNLALGCAETHLNNADNIKAILTAIEHVRADRRELQKHEAHAESRSRRRERGI